MNLFEAKKILHSFGYTLNESKELVTKFWSVSKAMKQHEVIELSDSEKEELINFINSDEGKKELGKYYGYAQFVAKKLGGSVTKQNVAPNKPEEPVVKDLRDPSTGFPPLNKENFFKLWPEGYVIPYYDNYRKNSNNYNKCLTMKKEADTAIWAYNKKLKDKITLDLEATVREIGEGLDIKDVIKINAGDDTCVVTWKPTPEDLDNEKYNERKHINPEHPNVCCVTKFRLKVEPIYEEWILPAIKVWKNEHKNDYAGTYGNDYYWQYPVDHYEVQLEIEDYEGPHSEPYDSCIKTEHIDQDNIINDSIDKIQALLDKGRYKVYDPDKTGSTYINTRSQWLDYDDYKLKRWGHWH